MKSKKLYLLCALGAWVLAVSIVIKTHNLSQTQTSNQTPGMGCVACTYKWGCIKYWEMSEGLISNDGVCDERPIDHAKKEDFEKFVIALFDPKIPDEKKEKYFNKQSWQEFTLARAEYELIDVFKSQLNSISMFRDNEQRYAHTDAIIDFRIYIDINKTERINIDIIHRYEQKGISILEWRTQIQSKLEGVNGRPH